MRLALGTATSTSSRSLIASQAASCCRVSPEWMSVAGPSPWLRTLRRPGATSAIRAKKVAHSCCRVLGGLVAAEGCITRRVRLLAVVGIRWDARTYDRTSATQQAWASDVLARLHGIAADATVLDVGCGTGLVTEGLLALVPLGRVLAIDQSSDMVALARTRLGDRALIWCQDVLELELEEPVDAVISTATLHWVPDHDRLWSRLASALGPGGVLEVQCGGEGNINRVREVIDAVASELAPELTGFSPWVFASPQETEQRLQQAGFTEIRCWLEERPTYPEDVGVRADVDPRCAPRPAS